MLEFFSVFNVVSIALIFSRIMGLFLLLPVFGDKSVPINAKIGLIFFMSLVALPVVGFSQVAHIDTFIQFLVNLIIEFFIGLSFGLVISIMINAVYVLGILIDNNIGFSMVSVIGANQEAQVPVSANLFYMLVMIVFLMTNAHHLVIEGIIKSFEYVPIGGEYLNLFMVYDLVDLVSLSFEVGFKIAAPVVVTILVANVMLGLLSKAMPGMNVFMIGMPFKVMIGLVLFVLLMPIYYNVIVNMFYKALDIFENTIIHYL